MKVALIASDNNASSGAFLSMTNLAIQLNQLGVETLIVIPPDGMFVGPGDGEALLKQYKLNYKVMPSLTWIIPMEFQKTILTTLGQLKYIFRNKIYARRLAKLLRKEQVDIVHINTSYSYFGVYAARYARLPFVWHIREFLEEDQRNCFYFKKYAYRLLNQAALVVAISQSIYQKYCTIIKKDTLKVIYNGIDTKQFYKPERTIFSSDRLTLCYVGGLSEPKGTDDLIEACKMLNVEGYAHAYRLLLAGRGDEAYEKTLKEKIKAYDLKNIEFLGYQKNVPAVMEQADVSVVTSKSEAFGRVTVEAMLTGNLVLGADSAGTKELLRDGEFGVLYQCGNPDSLKEQILYIMKHQKELRSKAAHARSYMAETMTAQRNAEAVYAEYKRILGD